MKRALILALVLLALALFAVWRSREPQSSSLAPLAAEPNTGSREIARTLEDIHASEVASRSSLAEDPDTTQPPNAFDSKSPTATTCKLRVEVLYTATGRAVRRASVHLGTPRVDARTDEHGIAAFELPIGTSLGSIRADAGDEGDPFVPFEREIEQTIVAGANELAVRVERGADLRGIVRDAATGHPLADARVRYVGLGSRSGITTREDGSFELLGLLAGPWNRPGSVEVQHPRYFEETRALEVSDLAPSAQPILVAMRRGILLAGRILDSSGNPAPRARIDLFGEDVRTTNADEHGHFEFGGLAESDHATLSTPTQSLLEGAILASQLELGALRSDQTELEVVVPAGIVLRVYAESPDGKQLGQRQFEVSGVEDLVEGPRSPGSSTRAFHEAIVARGPNAQLEVYSNAATDADPDALALGKATVRTGTDVASPLAVHVQLSERCHLEIPALPGGVSEFQPEISLLPKGAFDIRFLDAVTGLPIAQGRSITISTKGWINPEEVGPDGGLRLRGVPGTYVLHAQLEGGPREVLPIRIPLSGYAKSEWRVRSKP